jgi:hypothetical protein
MNLAAIAGVQLLNLQQRRLEQRPLPLASLVPVQQRALEGRLA